MRYSVLGIAASKLLVPIQYGGDMIGIGTIKTQQSDRISSFQPPTLQQFQDELNRPRQTSRRSDVSLISAYAKRSG